MLIKQVFVFVVADRGPTDEGIPALQILDTSYPMVGADMRRAESLFEHAQAVADLSSRQVELRRFGDDGMVVLKRWGKNPPKCTSGVRDPESDRFMFCDLWEGHEGSHENWWRPAGMNCEIDPQGTPTTTWRD